jgi:hypothetical protein
VILLLGLQSIEHWSVVDSVLSRLRGMGAAGAFIAAILVSPVVPLSLAIAAIALAWQGRKEKKVPIATPALPLVENNPSLVQNVSPHIEVNVGSQDPRPSEPEEEKRDTANIISLKAKEIWLHCNATGVWYEASTNLELAPRGIVLPFKNLPKQIGEHTPKADSVTASLVFRGINAADELNINHGVWLKHYEYFATFNSGETNYLLVAVKLVPYVTFENPNSSDPFRSRRFRSGMSVHHPQAIALWEEGQVEVVLVDTRNVTVFHGVFDYKLTLEKTSLTPAPPCLRWSIDEIAQ